MHLDDYDYNLPEELIAQSPTSQRDKSRLMVLNRSDKTVEHKVFSDIIDYLKDGDCLVLNDSKVIPARLFGTKVSTGAKIEFLLIKRINENTWETMVRPSKKLKIGDKVVFGENNSLEAEMITLDEDGTRHARFTFDGVFEEVLEEIGNLPLPPYIKRMSDTADKNRYQTVYSKNDGSVAAPTAGLHFTKELLQKAKDKGVNIAYVTLHVGIGTFRPVKVENILEHEMHFESYSIDEENAKLINSTKEKGNRVIAVGTTSVRTVESAAKDTGKVVASNSATNLFVYPGYKFNVIDALITNFHLPKSTLLMLVSALYSRDDIMNAYDEAVKEKYRFFSYGDAMFIF